ncbi:MAG: ribonuclease P protein component [Bacteroidales bacterium]|nr:ribonuclease P protein component [Bacteroidales bacterium]
MKYQGFSKPERLCSIKTIAGLFEKGFSFNTRLLKVIWAESPVLLPYPAQVAFSVPKKKFRHAVTRNLIKRRMREAYRKQKNSLYDFLISNNKQIVFILVFRGNEPADYPETESAVADALIRLSSAVKENTGKC